MRLHVCTPVCALRVGESVAGKLLRLPGLRQWELQSTWVGLRWTVWLSDFRSFFIQRRAGPADQVTGRALPLPSVSQQPQQVVHSSLQEGNKPWPESLYLRIALSQRQNSSWKWDRNETTIETEKTRKGNKTISDMTETKGFKQGQQRIVFTIHLSFLNHSYGRKLTFNNCTQEGAFMWCTAEGSSWFKWLLGSLIRKHIAVTP